ncbi:MAG: hypothetical protein IT365_12830 [Candidatus Hydrogenedentes bacterium]|nr:hypothetical protein [Candidatus Hydrogenedentota bacterium]
MCHEDRPRPVIHRLLACFILALPCCTNVTPEPSDTNLEPLTLEYLRTLGVDGDHIDIGACPFEGCTYGVWTARQDTNANNRPVVGSRSAFTLRKGERILADSGFVVTRKAGEAVVKNPIVIGTHAVEAGAYIEILHYAGEGFSLVRHEGELDKIEIDGVSANKIAEEDSIWWVRCRNSQGALGWLKDPRGFEGSDAIG